MPDKEAIKERAGFVVAVRLGETVSRFPLQNGRNPNGLEIILVFHVMVSGVGVREQSAWEAEGD